MQSADTKATILTLQEQRLRVQQLELQTQAEYNAAKEILENDQKAPQGGSTLGRSLPKPGPSIDSVVEWEKRRQCTLIEQHNKLQFAVRAKESQLLEMEPDMKVLELDSIPDDDEQHYDQHVRQLEDSLENMTIKITEAERIQKTYLRVCDHLHQEVCEMPMAPDQLQNSVAGGQSELGKVAHMSRTAVAAVDCTKSQLVHVERQLLVERRMMEKELTERRGAKEKEVEGRLEGEREGERRSSRVAQKLKEQVREEETERETAGELEGETEAQQTVTAPITTQSVFKLVEDIGALREALSCTDLQVWSSLEQSIMMEPRNPKRASSPVDNSASEDTFQFRSLEEDCSLSREPKKKAPRGTKRS